MCLDSALASALKVITKKYICITIFISMSKYISRAMKKMCNSSMDKSVIYNWYMIYTHTINYYVANNKL